MTQMHALSIQGAQALKEDGQQLALSLAGADWCDQAMHHLCRFIAMTGAVPFLFEDFRQYAIANGLPVPASHKVWGALPRVAVGRGLIQPTGRYLPTRSPRTHAHPAKEWIAV